MKSGTGCKHERLRTVGDNVFCVECGEELPLEYLYSSKKGTGKAGQSASPEKVTPENKTPRKGRKTANNDGGDKE